MTTPTYTVQIVEVPAPYNFGRKVQYEGYGLRNGARMALFTSTHGKAGVEAKAARWLASVTA